MNSTSIKIILFLLLGSYIYSGCNQNSSPKPYYLISDEFKEYCYFSDSSHWVFQNDSTLAIDSVIISEVKDSKRFVSEPTQYNYQAVDMFTSNNVFNISRYEITAGNAKPKAGEMNSLFRLYFEDGTYHIVFSPKYPMGEEIILGDAIGDYTNVEIIENFQLNGNSFKDVWHTKVVISLNNDIEYDYWIAKNYGLIKIVETIDGQTTSISLKSAILDQDPVQ